MWMVSYIAYTFCFCESVERSDLLGCEDCQSEGDASAEGELHSQPLTWFSSHSAFVEVDPTWCVVYVFQKEERRLEEGSSEGAGKGGRDSDEESAGEEMSGEESEAGEEDE